MGAVDHSRSDLVAGFLLAFSLALAGIAVVRQPGLLAPVAILIAIVAARMTVAYRRLAVAAVAASTVAFLAGMVVAIVTDSPLY